MQKKKMINVVHKITGLEIPFGLTIAQDVLNEMVIFDDVNTNAKAFQQTEAKLML